MSDEQQTLDTDAISKAFHEALDRITDNEYQAWKNSPDKFNGLQGLIKSDTDRKCPDCERLKRSKP